MNFSRLIKMKMVLELCAISRATLYRQIKAGHFPEPVRLTGGANDQNNSALVHCMARGRNTSMDY
jgi:predicted site-specific integrase-resolvase